MNRNEKNPGITSHTDASVSNIRSDPSANSASSGKSASAREPQHGTGVDSSTGKRGAKADVRPDSTSRR